MLYSGVLLCLYITYIILISFIQSPDYFVFPWNISSLAFSNILLFTFIAFSKLGLPLQFRGIVTCSHFAHQNLKMLQLFAIPAVLPAHPRYWRISVWPNESCFRAAQFLLQCSFRICYLINYGWALFHRELYLLIKA